MAMVESRFAGGPITIAVEDLDITDVKMVGFRAPASEFPLFPEEARVLAVRLIEAAAAAEKAEASEWP